MRVNGGAQRGAVAGQTTARTSRATKQASSGILDRAADAAMVVYVQLENAARQACTAGNLRGVRFAMVVPPLAFEGGEGGGCGAQEAWLGGGLVLIAATVITVCIRRERKLIRKEQQHNNEAIVNACANAQTALKENNPAKAMDALIESYHCHTSDEHIAGARSNLFNQALRALPATEESVEMLKSAIDHYASIGRLDSLWQRLGEIYEVLNNPPLAYAAYVHAEERYPYATSDPRSAIERMWQAVQKQRSYAATLSAIVRSGFISEPMYNKHVVRVLHGFQISAIGLAADRRGTELDAALKILEYFASPHHIHEMFASKIMEGLIPTCRLIAAA